MPLQHPSKTTQNRPKTTPRVYFLVLEFRSRSGIDFGSILVAKMPPFGDPLGTLWATKIDEKIDLNLDR